jgi:hypothetical protein
MIVFLLQGGLQERCGDSGRFDLDAGPVIDAFVLPDFLPPHGVPTYEGFVSD